MGHDTGFRDIANDYGQNPRKQASFAVALMRALQGYSGGVPGILDNLRRNGLSDLLATWTSGRQQVATPQQVQRGLGGTGVIEQTAAHAGVSSEAAAAAIAPLLPALIRHFAPGGHASHRVVFEHLMRRMI